MKPKAYKFQRRAIHKINRFEGRALIAHDPGLGKTITSLLWAVEHPLVKPIIVVCPASIKYQWEREAKSKFGMRSVVIEGMKANPRILGHCNLYIINYEILKVWWPLILTLKPKLLILDEGHYCSNSRAKRSKIAKKLSIEIQHLLILTGTPISNRPIEIWQLVNMINPSKFPSRFSFGMRWCNGKKDRFGWDFSGSSHLDELRSILKRTCMSRVLKHSVLKDLPKKTSTVIPVKLSDEKEYLEAKDNYSTWLGSRFHKGRIIPASRAIAITKMGHLLRLTAKLKLKPIMEWIDNFLEESESKLVCFAVNRFVIKELKERYGDLGVVVNGEVIGRDRQRAIDSFVHRKKTRLFLGNIQAAGVGCDGLQRVSSTVAFLQLPWTPGALRQAIGRLERIGQKDPINVFYLLGKNTIEGRIGNLIQSKDGVLSAALDGGNNVDNLNFFDQMIKSIRKDKHN